MTNWITESDAVKRYDWLVESRLSKSDRILAITTGTDESGETVFFVCESESGSLTAPENREYGIITVCYDKSEAEEKLDQLEAGNEVESNLILD